MKKQQLHLAFFVVLIGSAACLSVQAKTKPAPLATPPASLREQALIENQIFTRTESNNPTDAAIDGILSLKDPRPEVTTREGKYFLNLSVQEFQSQGSVTNEFKNTFALAQNNSAVMPALSFGYYSPITSRPSFDLNYGIAGKLAYSSQSAKPSFPQGYGDIDAQLNTTVLSLKPLLNLSLASLPRLQFKVGFEYGNINYTQTSTSEYSTFSKQAGILGFNTGLAINLDKSWALTLDYNQHQLAGSNQGIDVQANNYELGTLVKW